MQLPLVKDAPIVSSFARNFKSVFQNNSQYQHFKDYLSGLIVLENKSLSNIARCTLDCCDKSNLSRFFSNEGWQLKSMATQIYGISFSHFSEKALKQYKEECFL